MITNAPLVDEFRHEIALPVFFVQPEHGHVKVGSQTFTGFINLNIIKEIEANQEFAEMRRNLWGMHNEKDFY